MNPRTYKERRKPIAHDSDNPIERLKTAYDLQAMAESFGFKFKVRGKLRTARCLLPSHEDTNPSFAIYPDQRFHCFGCNMHGDVLDLVALMTNNTLSEALADLRMAIDGGRRLPTAQNSCGRNCQDFQSRHGRTHQSRAPISRAHPSGLVPEHHDEPG
ncbi:MAG: CHC2 zinc finger domain-containing protein [Dehalococcoidia bacterium]|nr:CHC2 zinc finger domain-containing protein [Dehalococcoidia bacterium]